MGNLFREKLQTPHKYEPIDSYNYYVQYNLYHFVICRKSMYLALFNGLMYGLSDGLIFFMYTAAFRFSAFLITLEPDNVGFTTYKGIVM